MEIRPLYPEELPGLKDRLLELILKGLRAHPPVIESPEDTFNLALEGRVQIWAFIENGIKGMFCTSILPYVIHVYGFAGKDIIRHIPRGLEILKDFSRVAGIQYIQIAATKIVAERVIKEPYEELALITLNLTPTTIH